MGNLFYIFFPNPHRKNANVAPRNVLLIAHSKVRLLQTFRQVAHRPFLRLVQRQLPQRLDASTVRHDLQRLLPPGIIRNPQRIFAGPFATGNQAEALTHLEKHLGAKSFIQDTAHVLEQRIGLG